LASLGSKKTELHKFKARHCGCGPVQLILTAHFSTNVIPHPGWSQLVGWQHRQYGHSGQKYQFFFPHVLFFNRNHFGHTHYHHQNTANMITSASKKALGIQILVSIIETVG
jgi:hypothetical protein